MNFDVVVIGAGIVGTACAERLAREGLRVCIVDRAREVGGGATAEAMGQIVAMDDSEAQFALTRYSQVLWEELVQELPAGCEMFMPGSLWVAEDDDEMVAVHKKATFYRNRGVACEVLGPAELIRVEPQLRTSLAGGLEVAGDRVVYPPVAASFLLERAVAQGAEVRLGTEVRAVTAGEVVLADGVVISAGEVVLATGCAALDLLADHHFSLSIRPRKGHLCITDRYPGFLNHQVIELGYLKSAHSAESDSVAFNAQPRATGQILLGSSRQFDKSTRNVEPALVKRMIDRAVHFMPGIANLNVVRTWTGFRAATEDHLPMIGRIAEGLLLASGHEGLGITTSLGTAVLITDEMLGRDSKIDRQPYRVDREVAHA